MILKIGLRLRFVNASNLATIEIERFHFLACPGGAPQEFEAGSNAGVMRKTADIDFSSQRIPAMATNQLVEHFLERDAVQRIVRLGRIHWLAVRILSSFSTTA